MSGRKGGINHTKEEMDNISGDLNPCERASEHL